MSILALLATLILMAFGAPIEMGVAILIVVLLGISDTIHLILIVKRKLSRQ